MNFYQKHGSSYAPKPTKYDACTLQPTGRPYRYQEGSGRAAIFNNYVTPGITVREVIEKAAVDGYAPAFTLGAIFRQHDTPEGGWVVVAPEGQTLAEIKGTRPEREMSPEALAKREAREREAAEKAAARERRRVELNEARAVKEREKAEAAQVRAAAKAEKEARKAAAAESAVPPAEATGEAKPGRARRKGKAPAAEVEAA